MLPKTDLKNVYKVSRKLLKNPENLRFVLYLLYLTNSPSLRKMMSKLLDTKEGGKLIYEREEIFKYFSTLSSRPTDSVGRKTYEVFPDRQKELIDTSTQSHILWIDSEHPYTWLARRYRDVHDVWHVLAGYEPDLTGEMCLGMFSYTQTKAIGLFLFCILIVINRGMQISDIKLLLEAYRIGKNTKFLLAENYDTLLSENLEEARIRLGIKEPKYYNQLRNNS